MKLCGMSVFSRRPRAFALCLAALALSPVAPLPAQEAAPAPLARWVFGEPGGTGILDHSGNNNDAEILEPGGAERMEDARTGIPALWFGGGGPPAGSGCVESWALAGKLGGPAFSVSAWVRPESPQAYAPIVTKVTDLDAWDDGFGVCMGPGGAPEAFAGGYGAAALPGAHAARAGEWSHVCLTSDGAEAKFYVNGKLRSFAPVAGMAVANNAPVRVGTLAGASGARAWHGAVADVRVYDAALSGDDVLSLFAESPLAGAADTLGQGFPDLWATFYGLNPLDPALAGQVLSGDGLTVLRKYQLGMDPGKAAAAPMKPMLRIHTPLEK